MPMSEQFRKDYPIISEIPVRWGDMDAFQHVNNTIFFRYFECARIELFFALQNYHILREKGIGPILAYTDCKFLAPLRHPDHVLAGAKIASIESSKFAIDHAIYSEQLGKLAGKGVAKIVWYDYNEGHPTDMTEELIEELKRYK